MSPRPMHLRAPLILLVAVGGAVGSGARYWLSGTLSLPHGLPVATLVENVVGAFLLGVLLEALLRQGPETERIRLLRLGLGTGLLGGFTTFSTLALEVERFLAEGSPALAVGYGLGSMILGALAAVLGIAVGAWGMRRRGRTASTSHEDPSLEGSIETGKDLPT
ncbi:CrcB family protein [Actinotalea sp. K2]|nr:CrcB family protein [Actinotalea sp. K2]MCL3861121.1 CrcB family protein [Actinotalea sp. K2]